MVCTNYKASYPYSYSIDRLAYIVELDPRLFLYTKFKSTLDNLMIFVYWIQRYNILFSKFSITIEYKFKLQPSERI